MVGCAAIVGGMRKDRGVFVVSGLIAAIWGAYLVWHYRFQPHYKNYDVTSPATSGSARQALAATTIVGLVTVLSASPPHGHEDAERATGIHLVPHEIGGDQFYEARDIKLADGEQIDLVQSYKVPWSRAGYVVFSVSGRCYTEDEVKRQFPALHRQSDEMRALNPSLSASTPSLERASHTLTRQEGWGTLLFDYGERGNCLKSAWIVVN